MESSGNEKCAPPTGALPQATRLASPSLLLLLSNALTLSFLPALADARPPSVKVEVVGIESPLRENVLAALSIADRKQRRGATESEVRHLHARAENEIKRALEPFGYYRPLIHSNLQTEGGWIARYEIQPGPPILLDSVRVELTGEGSADPEYQKRVRDFPLHKGDVLVHPAYERGKAAFESYAADGGYLDAAFTVSRINVDLERYAASIDLRIHTGPRHYFGRVDFDQDVIDSGVVAKYLTFKRGDPFDFRKLLELRTALSSSGFFEQVDVQPGEEFSDHREVPIEVTLTPSRRVRFTGGLGYGTDDGARARSIIEMRRLNRQGHHAQLTSQWGRLDTNAGLQYLIPWLNPRTDMLTFSAGYQKLRTDVSRSEITQGGVSVSRMLSLWQTTLGLSYRNDNFTVGPDHGITNFLVPEASWNRVRTPDRFFTRNGDRVRFGVRGAHRSLLSDGTFFQPRVEGKVIKSFSQSLRGLARVEVGVTSTPDFRRLPPSMRFFAGGANSVRGYGFNSLGPKDESGRVIGGRHLLTGSLEADYFFLERWGMAWFVDAGNAMNSFREPLQRGVGAGLRWVSPLGMVRADAGWGLDSPGRAFELHFTVGPEL